MVAANPKSRRNGHNGQYRRIPEEKADIPAEKLTVEDVVAGYRDRDMGGVQSPASILVLQLLAILQDRRAYNDQKAVPLNEIADALAVRPDVVLLLSKELQTTSFVVLELRTRLQPDCTALYLGMSAEVVAYAARMAKRIAEDFEEDARSLEAAASRMEWMGREIEKEAALSA